MASIMQGTTPSLTITIDPDDLQLSSVTLDLPDGLTLYEE